MSHVRIGIPASLVAACLLAACGEKIETDPAIAKVMDERHEGFETIGEAFKTINDTLKAGGSLNEELVQAAQVINAHAQQVEAWFPAGSGPEAGKTRARPEIWQQPQLFASKVQAFETEAQKLEQLAEAGDAAGFAEQVKALGGSCKGCHDNFRLEED